MGLLERKIDVDLVARIENGWKPHQTALPLKKVKPVRQSISYRGALRNRARQALHDTRVMRLEEALSSRHPRPTLRGLWPGVESTRRVYHPPVRPNRSPKWDTK